MKPCGILTALLVCISLQPKAAAIGRQIAAAFPPGEEFGILLETAYLWVGIPEDRNAMVLAKIPEGTKVKILELTDQYYRVMHKNLIGYLDQESVGIIGSNIQKYLPQKVADVSSTASKVTIPSTENDNISEQPSAEQTDNSENTSIFIINKATSLRAFPSSQAEVFLRFKVGSKISKILDKSNKYWWEVEYNGHIGWVKCALLDQH